jgi:epoxyqueuosine reductase
MGGHIMTTEELRELAYKKGLDLLGVANIERFAGAPARMHPASIFPEAKSVIVVGRRIVRGGWRGIEEGTYWPNYSYFCYSGLLNTYFIPVGLYDIACYIEDQGWEAVPYYSGVPEAQPPIAPLREGAPAPDVHLAIRIAGVAAGLGEMGWSKVFLTKRFGPRQRLHAIITDAPLEPDPLIKPGTICNKCMACVKGCPGAIPHIREGKKISIKIEDNTYEWADIDFGKCTLAYHGGDPRLSPFIHKDMPGWEFDATKQEISEDTGYKLSTYLSTGRWRKTEENPSGYYVEGHAMLRWDGGGLGVGGSRGCMRSCFNELERQRRIEQTFKGGEFIKRPRWLLSHKVAKRGKLENIGEVEASQ